MSCCLTAPSHYLDQCWLMISEVLWHSPDSNFTENTLDIYHWNDFEIYSFETVVKSHRGQWIKPWNHAYYLMGIYYCGTTDLQDTDSNLKQSVPVSGAVSPFIHCLQGFFKSITHVDVSLVWYYFTNVSTASVFSRRGWLIRTWVYHSRCIYG